MRGSTEVSDHVELRRSSAMKKCVSGCGVFCAVLYADGMGGTLGEAGGDRPVTPGMYAIWMTFDARVSTVLAMECVLLPALRLRVVWSRFSGGSQVSLRFFWRNMKYHTQKARIETAATPPITPPTMGPMGVEALGSDIWPWN